MTTSTSDSRGRPSIQTAELLTGTSNTTYTYGAFDLLKKEQTDTMGQTELAYDVLGRLTTVTRTLPGIRVTEYNAYGDVTRTYKKTSAAGTVEPVTYGRDALGRLTLVTATGVARNLYWDKTAGGEHQTNSIGNLVDVYDGVNGANSKVHFNYNGLGLLQDQSWTMSLFGAAAQSYGTASFTYDPQGRLATLTYPKNLPGTYTAFTAQYTYDPYAGDVKSIADSAAPSNPLWQVTERSKWGSAATEALRSSGGTAITKTNSYYPFTGALQKATLGAATLTNYYYRNDLPAAQVWGGVGNAWTTNFEYDNLKRLTTWTPAIGAPVVTYGYDSDGNLNSRSWIGETVTYSLLGTAGRKATVVVNGNVRTDNYAADVWSRINDTPSSTLTYNAVDEVTNVVEKTNGSLADKIIRSGNGERLATTYGTVSSGPYLLTLLGDLYEYKYTNSTTREERYRLRAGGTLVGDVVRTTAAGPKTSTFYLTDNVGSVVAEASNTGVVTARMRRDPYGNALVDAGAPFMPTDPIGTNPDGTSRLGFGGHERDPNWGLVDMKARFYAPALGRFIAPDSIVSNAFDRRDYNPFAYAGNNPVAMNDPTGRATERTPDPFNPPPLQPPDGGKGGPGSDPPGSGSCTSHCSPPRGSNLTPHPVNPYVAATGTVPTSQLTTTNGATTANTALRSHGPTEGSATKSRAAGAPWSALNTLDNVGDGIDVTAFVAGRAAETIRSVAIPVADASPDEVASAFRFVQWRGRILTEGSNFRLFSVLDRAPGVLKFAGNRVLSPFMTGYHLGELTDNIANGNGDDVLMSVMHIVGDWVPFASHVENLAKNYPQYKPPPPPGCGQAPDLPRADFALWDDFSRALALPPPQEPWRQHIVITPIP